MTLSLSVTESGSGEKGEGAFRACLGIAAQAGTDPLCIKSWSQGQGRAQMVGRLQATPQPLAQPSLAARVCSSVTPCLCLPSPSLWSLCLLGAGAVPASCHVSRGCACRADNALFHSPAQAVESL